MIIIKNLEDIRELKDGKSIKSEIIKLIKKDLTDTISEIEELGMEYSPEKFGVSIIVESNELITSLEHLNMNILEEKTPIFAYEFSSSIIKTCVHLQENYYLTIYFDMYEQPMLYEWSLVRMKKANKFKTLEDE
ncbi:hypothetical protein ACU8YK_00240 [Bacillus paranthracis]